MSVCVVCGSELLSGIGNRSGYDIVKCADCEVSFTSPMPSKKELKEFYDQEAYFHGDLEGGYRDYDLQTEPVIASTLSYLEGFDLGQSKKKVLDFGCGYGSHLAEAQKKGWEVYGLELSAHARSVAKERLGQDVPIAAQVGDLPEIVCDVILMLDVIEHLEDPYQVFYDLFSHGVIGKQTKIVVTTPNAGCAASLKEGVDWMYTHPPAHLIYYTAKSLSFIFDKLKFTHVKCEGLYGDGPEDLDGSPGLLLVAEGSDFRHFMQERFVPGTWSDITSYEHLPRYAAAQRLCRERRVLDFGCGSGYGSAMLAEVADEVNAVDISEEALSWAKQTHKKRGLSFNRNQDLGDTLAGGYGVAVCFEVIEHLTEQDQVKLLKNLGSKITEEGILFLSTPNPKITALYGDNPYHLNELGLSEFQELGERFFDHVELVGQYVSPAVTLYAKSESENSFEESQVLSGVQSPQFSDAAIWLMIAGNNKSQVSSALEKVRIFAPDLSKSYIEQLHYSDQRYAEMHDSYQEMKQNYHDMHLSYQDIHAEYLKVLEAWKKLTLENEVLKERVKKMGAE